MIRPLGLTVVLAVLSVPALAGVPRDDPAAPARQFIDGFNSGDTKSAYAAYVSGDVAIIDEFTPHFWAGPKAPQNWAAAYEKNAAAEGVSDGHVGYGKPTVVNVEGDAAYVTLPATYTYKSHGAATSEEANMVFAMKHTKEGWKIRGWAWTGTVPHAAK